MAGSPTDVRRGRRRRTPNTTNNAIKIKAESASFLLKLCEDSAIIILSLKKRFNSKPNTKMKITISHDQDTIDPSSTYSDDQFVEVKAALESEYETAILKGYPDAEVDCSGTDTTYSIRVTETGMDDPSDIETDIQRICELVFETGNFWV